MIEPWNSKPWPVWKAMTLLVAVVILPWIVIAAAVQLLFGWPL